MFLWFWGQKEVNRPVTQSYCLATKWRKLRYLNSVRNELNGAITRKPWKVSAKRGDNRLYRHLSLVICGSSAHTSWSGILQTGQGGGRQCTANKLPFLDVRIAATATQSLTSRLFNNSRESIKKKIKKRVKF